MSRPIVVALKTSVVGCYGLNVSHMLRYLIRDVMMYPPI